MEKDLNQTEIEEEFKFQKSLDKDFQKKIHYQMEVPVQWKGEEKRRYLCNQACAITESKITKIKKEVTCKNCLRELEKDESKKVANN